MRTKPTTPNQLILFDQLYNELFKPETPAMNNHEYLTETYYQANPKEPPANTESPGNQLDATTPPPGTPDIYEDLKYDPAIDGKEYIWYEYQPYGPKHTASYTGFWYEEDGRIWYEIEDDQGNFDTEDKPED